MSRRRQPTPGPLPDTWVHLYAQAMWHSEAAIEGTRDGLKALRGAIDEALRKNGEAETALLFTADGEGYRTRVRMRTTAQMKDAALPYVDEIARDPRRTGDS